nr:LD-carboxypeptidase [Bacteroidales bacterium]
ALMGTAAEPDTRGKILFLEDVGESYYHIDRMFTSLRLAGKLEGLAALVIGGMNRMEDTKIPWAETLEATIFSAVQGYGYPVFFGFPAGHIADNRSVYIGRDARIELSGRKAVIEYV